MAKRPSDPTRTITLRRYFVNQFNARFNAISMLIKMSVIDNDCFNLKPSTFSTADPIGQTGWKSRLMPLKRGPYAFERTAEKIQWFLDWLHQEESKSVFEIMHYANLGSGVEPIWANIYIREFYKKGIRWGRDNLNAAGTKPKLPTDSDSIQLSMGQTEHVDRLGAIYTRTFTDLKGITATMDAQMSAVLAEGLRKGDNPRVIAKSLINRVDKMAKYRATLVARTESIRAHHVASIQEYRNAGVTGVEVQSEWSTAGDDRVCRRCAPLDYDRTGKVYPLDEIEGIIPLHPQCRCAALPHIKELEGIF